MAFGMNPQRAKHMGQEHSGSEHKPEPAEHQAEPKHESGGAHPQSIHIHHAGSGEPNANNPHHVHIHHASGEHEHSDHQNFSEALSHTSSAGGGENEQEHGGEEEDFGLSGPGSY